MISSVAIALELPDGRHVLQRRDKNALVYPGTLGYIGGRRETSDLCGYFAIAREFEEELGQPLKGAELISRVAYLSPSSAHSAEPFLDLSIFKSRIDSLPEIIYEGAGVEAVYPTELMSKKDTAPSARFIARVIEESIG